MGGAGSRSLGFLLFPPSSLSGNRRKREKLKKERKIHLPSFPPSSSLALYSRGYREERKRQKRGEIGRASSFGPPDEKKK